jgi:hypothetical protein
MDLELRQQYKNVILSYCRSAVRAGVMSDGLENFLIDEIDDYVDNLPEWQFDHLLMKRVIPIAAIQNDEEYERVLQRMVRGAELIESGKLLPEELKKAKELYESLERMIREYRSEKGDGHAN